MEPERKIEKWLRAFAKKRRDQAGAPLELHPATRRVLQGEVRRQFGAPERKRDSFLKNFLRISFRPVEMLVVVAIVALLAALLLPALSKAKMKAQSVNAMSNLRQIGAAARMFAEDNSGRLPASYGEMTNYLHGEDLTRDPVSGERFVYLGGGQSLGNLQSGSVLAYSPTDKKGRAVLFADGHVEIADRTRFSGLTNRGLQQLAYINEDARRRPAEMPAASPPAAAPVEAPQALAATAPSAETLTVSKRLLKADLDKEKSTSPVAAAEPASADRSENHTLGVAPATGLDQISSPRIGGFVAMSTNTIQWAANIPRHFVRSDIASDAFYRLKDEGGAAKTAPVLASFQVKPNGREIRVVDQDGSIYEGSMESVAEIQDEPLLATGKPADNGTRDLLTPKAPVPVRQLEENAVLAGQDKGQAADGYFFRVTGTNLSLKQSVVFTGNLRAIAQGTLAAPAGDLSGGGGGSQNMAVGQSASWSLSNARISGTAVIGLTNRVEINAVPAAP